MPWDRRGYYYDASKENGRVVRKYIGKGKFAELCSQVDDLEREKRQIARINWKIDRDLIEAWDADTMEVIKLADLLARAALIAAGYRQHKRSEWRRRRAPKS